MGIAPYSPARRVVTGHDSTGKAVVTLEAPSLDALNAYSTGVKVNTASGSAEAIPFFQRAIGIDPKFAMAYANLGLAYSGSGQSVLAAQNTTASAVGETFAPMAQRVLLSLDEALDNLTNLKELRRGLVRVAAPETLSCTLLPELIAGYNNSHPGVDVRFDRAHAAPRSRS